MHKAYSVMLFDSFAVVFFPSGNGFYFSANFILCTLAKKKKEEKEISWWTRGKWKTYRCQKQFYRHGKMTESCLKARRVFSCCIRRQTVHTHAYASYCACVNCEARIIFKLVGKKTVDYQFKQFHW